MMVRNLPSDDYNYEEAMEVVDGVRTIDDCEDPDAVMDILDDEYHPHRFDDVDNSYVPQGFDNNGNNMKNKTDSSSICSIFAVLFLIFAVLMMIF